MSDADRPLLGSQTPRICLVPEYVSSAAAEALEVADVAGLVLDPWQRLVLQHGLGETADGRWAAYEVGVVVARQNGKGTIQEIRELAGLFTLGERLIIHSAHEQATSSEHFRRILALIEGVPEFDRRVLKVSRGKGSEGIELDKGQRILFKTRTNGGGRGLTGDVVVLDEAMILPPSIMGTLVPMMSARSMVGNPQLWYAGSAVDQQKHVDGHYFGRVRERALSGKSADRLAFMEWSAPGDSPDGVSDDDLSDPELWAMANPGMGIRISSRHVAAERDALARREFAVERMGVGDWPTAADDRAALDLEAWKAATDAGSSIASGLCLAFDVSPDRSSASICAAGLRDDGIPHIERLPASKAPGPDTLTGTRWLVDRLLQLIEDHDPVAVVCDQRSPAMVFVKQLEDAGVEVRTTSANEHAEACGRLADAVNDRDLRHLGQPELTAAVRGAAKRQLGEAWGWSRRSSQVDISPLVACTLALWGLDRGGEEAPAFYFEVFS